MCAVIIQYMYCSVSTVVLYSVWERYYLATDFQETTDNSTKNYSSDLGSNVARTFPNYLIWSGTWNRNCFQKWKITGKHPVFLKTATFLFSTERFLIFWGPCFSWFDFSRHLMSRFVFRVIHLLSVGYYTHEKSLKVNTDGVDKALLIEALCRLATWGLDEK